MKPLVLHIGIVFAVVAAVLGTSVIFPQTESAHAAGSAPVTVLNTPLPVQGSVSAAQSGSWNVGINGTPTVNVASLPAVQVSGTVGISGGPVAVQNATGTALDVLTSESPAALGTLVKRVCTAGSALFSCGGTPPTADGVAGEFWVIDQVSGDCSAFAGTNVIGVEIVVHDATGTIGYPLPLTYPSAGAPESGVFFERTRIVATPFTAPSTATVGLGINFASVEHDAFCHATIAGHRVPRPGE